MDSLAPTVKGYQSEFVDPDLRFMAVFGAKGSGKTYVGALWALQMIAQGGKGLILMNSYAQTRDVFLQNIKPWLDKLNWPYSYSLSSMNLEVLGTTVHLRSAELGTIRKIESLEYDWGWADEASYFDPESMRIFLSRVRKGNACIRITSMPDEPDAFVYGFVENLAKQRDGIVQEIALTDNPDSEFVKRYEQVLRATYSGQQLARYLDGMRVSLEGDGAFALSNVLLGYYPYDPEEELLLSWDFNVEYCAVSAWQKGPLTPKAEETIACVRSWQLQGETIFDSAQSLAEELSAHKGLIKLHGDASGNNRSALATETMWQGVRNVFYKKFGKQLRFVVPEKNPNVRDTIECANWALKRSLVLFDSNERNVWRSLSASRLDRYGDLDKKNDYKAEAIKTHDADTARYAIWHYLSNAFPASRKSFFIV